MRKMSTVKLEFYNGSGEWNKGALYTMHINKNLLEKIVDEVMIEKIHYLQRKYLGTEEIISVENIIQQNSLSLNYVIYQEACARGYDIVISKDRDVQFAS